MNAGARARTRRPIVNAAGFVRPGPAAVPAGPRCKGTLKHQAKEPMTIPISRSF